MYTVYIYGPRLGWTDKGQKLKRYLKTVGKDLKHQSGEGDLGVYRLDMQDFPISIPYSRGSGFVEISIEVEKEEDLDRAKKLSRSLRKTVGIKGPIRVEELSSEPTMEIAGLGFIMPSDPQYYKEDNSLDVSRTFKSMSSPEKEEEIRSQIKSIQDIVDKWEED